MTHLYEENIKIWDAENIKICNDIQGLRDMILKISKRYESILRRSNEIKDHELFKTIDEHLTKCKKVSTKVKIWQLYEKLKIGKQNIPKCHKDICDLIFECLEQREQLLKNPHLKFIQNNLSSTNKEFIKIQPITRNTFNLLLNYKSRIYSCYVERFNDIYQWNEKNTKEKYEKENENKISIPINGDFEKSIGISASFSGGSILNSMISLLDNKHDTKSLIEENEELRRTLSKSFDLHETEKD